jgi:2-polyprenyl-3-methyl-5-hydroxy-6-metoxy-1,4-benzoquinol methylase
MQASPDALISHPLTLETRGEHIHHGYWPTDESKASDSKETAQLNLIRLLLDISQLPADGSSSAGTNAKPLRILDVGCGIGGTTRYLASALGATVTGITISGKQVQIATRLSNAASSSSSSSSPTATSSSSNTANGDTQAQDGPSSFIPIGSTGGKVRFIELDAEKMGEFFASSRSSPGDGQEEEEGGFDAVWISEALSHFPNKALFFQNAHALLRPGGKLVLADWFKAEGLDQGAFEADIKPIEGPYLCVFFSFLSSVSPHLGKGVLTRRVFYRF